MSCHSMPQCRSHAALSERKSLDSSGTIANLVHQMQVDRLPRDYLDQRAAVIGGVAAEDVSCVARRLLRAEAMTTVVFGKPVGLTEP